LRLYHDKATSASQYEYDRFELVYSIMAMAMTMMTGQNHDARALFTLHQVKNGMSG